MIWVVYLILTFIAGIVQGVTGFGSMVVIMMVAVFFVRMTVDMFFLPMFMCMLFMHVRVRCFSRVFLYSIDQDMDM